MSSGKERAYTAIINFVTELNNEFKGGYKPVALYKLLLDKTGVQALAIDKHIQAFSKFFNENPGYIRQTMLSANARITYSDRVFLDMTQILSKTGKPVHACIHRHLLTIFTLINLGKDEAKEALQTLKSETPPSSAANVEQIVAGLNVPDTNEGKFVKDTFSEMVGHFENVDNNSNIMEIMGGMMQSGFIQKFMSNLNTNIQNGDMDVQKLMGTVTGLVSSVAPTDGSNPEGEQLMNLAKGMMDKIGTGTLDQSTQDSSDLLNSVTGMLGGNMEGDSSQLLSTMMSMMNVQAPAEASVDSIENVD